MNHQVGHKNKHSQMSVMQWVTTRSEVLRVPIWNSSMFWGYSEHLPVFRATDPCTSPRMMDACTSPRTQKNCIGRGQLTKWGTDIATTRPKRPKGRFGENNNYSAVMGFQMILQFFYIILIFSKNRPIGQFFLVVVKSIQWGVGGIVCLSPPMRFFLWPLILSENTGT